MCFCSHILHLENVKEIISAFETAENKQQTLTNIIKNPFIVPEILEIHIYVLIKFCEWRIAQTH